MLLEHFVFKRIGRSIGRVAGNAVIARAKQQRPAGNEKFETVEEEPSSAAEGVAAVGSVGAMIGITVAICLVFLGLGIWAAVLSWSSNTVVGWNVAAKVIFAIFAFFFNLSYLLGHLIYKLDLLNLIEKLSPAL